MQRSARLWISEPSHREHEAKGLRLHVCTSARLHVFTAQILTSETGRPMSVFGGTASSRVAMATHFHQKHQDIRDPHSVYGFIECGADRTPIISVAVS